MNQGAFHLDLNRCTGCSACAIACGIENDLPAIIAWRRIHTFNRSRLPQSALFHYSLACNHCLDPSCLEGCPAGAYTKDVGTGAVSLHEERCIGCRYCSWVCPYDAPRFDRAAGTMTKCSFCLPRLEQGLEPACTSACPVDALEYLPSAVPRAVGTPGFPEVGIRPAILVTPKRRDYRAPETIGSHSPGSITRPAVRRALQSEASWAGIRTEYSLLVFSFLAICLVAWFVARTARSESIAPIPFATVGACAMAVSALHLGKKIRVYRSIRNLRRSWVSREIGCFLSFYAAASLLGFLGLLPHPLPWITALVGFGALVSMDMVYRVRGQSVAAVPHSAMATLTALLLTGLLLQATVLVVTTGLIKICLYGIRLRGHRPVSRAMAMLRIGIGFLLPVAAWLYGERLDGALILIAVLIGEFVDRAQFYAGLQFLDPSRQIETDLAGISD